MSDYLLAIGIVSLSFLGLGLGIIFFGRKNISTECGTVPGKETDACLSKEAGMCPMDDSENYLKMATTATRPRHTKAPIQTMKTPMTETPSTTDPVEEQSPSPPPED